MFTRFDDFLLDRVFQPIADRIVTWTTPGQIAQSLILGSVAFYLFWIYVEWTEGELNWFLVIMSPIVLMWLSILAWEAGKETQREGMAPTARLRYRFVRLLTVVFTILAAFVLLPLMIATDTLKVSTVIISIQDVLETAGFYFAACRRNPPRQRQTSPAWATAGASNG